MTKHTFDCMATRVELILCLLMQSFLLFTVNTYIIEQSKESKVVLVLN